MYVEELPHLDLSEEQEDRLRHYLQSEIRNSETERQSFLDQMKDEIVAYEAPSKGRKQFPWQDASALTVPLIGSMVDTIFPRLHSTVFGSSTYVSIEEWPGELADHAKAWQDMLQWSMENELDIERVSDSWFMEAIIHGTSIVKVSWERLERVVTKYDNAGNIVSKDRETIRNQPVLTHVNLADFYIPFTARSIKEADWVAHRLDLNWGKLKLREFNGLYKNVDDIRYLTKPSSDQYEKTREDLEHTEPTLNDEYDIFEVWVNFDLDNNGQLHPLLVTFELDSGTFLRVQANPYNHRRAPFREIIYFPRHDRFFGFGLARQLMPIQEEISTIHNQRIDNATIANTRMWKVVAGSRADQSFQGAAPGLKVLVDALEEIEPMQLGDVAQSSFENERLALQYAQQRAGITDFLNGIDFGKGGGRQTATQAVAMMQEARTRFNWTLDQVRDAIADVASMVTDLYAQFGLDDMDKIERVLGDRAELVRELLGQSETRNLSSLMSLQVTASSASSNKAVEQQSLLGLMQMLQQVTQQFEMPLIQIVLNPQAPQAVRDYALEKIEGSRTLMRRIFETADVRNAAEVLGSTEELRKVVESVESAGTVPQPGPAVGPPTPPGIPGMGASGVPMAGPMGSGG